MALFFVSEAIVVASAIDMKVFNQCLVNNHNYQLVDKPLRRFLAEETIIHKIVESFRCNQSVIR